MSKKKKKKKPLHIFQEKTSPGKIMHQKKIKIKKKKKRQNVKNKTKNFKKNKKNLLPTSLSNPPSKHPLAFGNTLRSVKPHLVTFKEIQVL